MQNEIKTLNGIMNLDDSNEVMPSTHHKEARNGVFKGNAPEMHFTAIRGNSKVNNTSLIANDCRMSGSALFTPNCNIAGTAQYIGKCDLAGEAILQVNFTITSSCVLNDGKIIIGGITGGSRTYEIGNLAYATEELALASTGFTEGTSKTFNNMPDGTLWFVVRDKNNTSNKIAKSVAITCNGTSTECRSGVTVVIGTGGAEVFYQDCCGISRSVAYATAGTYTIADCIKGGSLSSPDNGFLSFSYSETTCTCIDFSLTKSCVLNDGKVIIDTIVGGTGVYEIGNLAYVSAANAMAGSGFTEGTSKTFNNMPDGRWYFVVRDKANPLNKITKYIDISCDGTSNECRNGLDVVIGSGGVEVFYQDCCGVARSVSYATAGNYTINDCIKAGSVSSPDNGFISYSYKTSLCNCVDFRVTTSCVLNDGKVIVDDPVGGSGTYEIGNLAYATEALALASTAFTEATSKTFNSMPDGGFWFVVRDKNNTLNKKAKSTNIECNGTSTECRNSVSVVINAVPTEVFYQDCCEVVKSVTYTTNGTYTITDCILVGSLSSPDNGFASFTYSATVCECIPPDPTPSWVDKGYNVCIDCVSYDVYRDENPNSLSYLKYKVNDVVGTTTAPTESACNTTEDYSSNVGTYYRCSAGTTLSDIVYKNTNPCFTGNQWKSGTVTYEADPSNTAPSTEAVLTDQGYYTCYQCADKLVYRDTNACSPSFERYFVNGDNVGLTQPPAGLCPTTSNWVDLEFKTCYGCEELQVYQNQQACVANSYKYRIGGTGGVIVDERPSNTLCNYAANWVLTGYNTCSSCTNYQVYRDTNPCSSTFAQYKVNNVVVGLTEPTRGNCITTSDYQDFGARVCVDCTSYQPQKDMNPCSSTAGNIKNTGGILGGAPCNTTDPSYTDPSGTYHYCANGTVYTAPVMANTNVCYSGGATAHFRADFGGGNYSYYGIGSNPANAYPSLDPVWYTVPIEYQWICEGTTKYYKETDINQCSPTGGFDRKGDVYATNSTDCGYVYIECSSYEIYNPDSNYDIPISYEPCGGSGILYDSVGPNMTHYVCATPGTFSGSGEITNLGGCSV